MTNNLFPLLQHFQGALRCRVWLFLTSYLADKVWDTESSVYLLQSDAVGVVQQRIQLVQKRPLIALTLTGGGRDQKII